MRVTDSSEYFREPGETVCELFPMNSMAMQL